MYFISFLFFLNFYMYICLFIFLFIFFLLIFINYYSKYINFNLLFFSFLEFLWTLLPVFLIFCLLLPLFIFKTNFFDVFLFQPFYFIASQWYWSVPIISFNYPFVLFFLTSTDVIHGFSVPLISAKVDCIPSVLNNFYHVFLAEGFYYGYCTELCGVNHSMMPFGLFFSTIPVEEALHVKYTYEF